MGVWTLVGARTPQLYESLKNFYKTFFPHEGVDLGRCTDL